MKKSTSENSTYYINHILKKHPVNANFLYYMEAPQCRKFGANFETVKVEKIHHKQMSCRLESCVYDKSSFVVYSEVVTLPTAL